MNIIVLVNDGLKGENTVVLVCDIWLRLHCVLKGQKKNINGDCHMFSYKV